MPFMNSSNNHNSSNNPTEFSGNFTRLGSDSGQSSGSNNPNPNPNNNPNTDGSVVISTQHPNSDDECHESRYPRPRYNQNYLKQPSERAELTEENINALQDELEIHEILEEQANSPDYSDLITGYVSKITDIFKKK